MKNEGFPPAGRRLRALLTSALILSLLAVQGTLLWASPTVSSTTPNTGSMNQRTSTVWTNHLKVQFFFPASAYPGQREPISVTATVKSNGRILRLSLDISSYVGKQLVKIASQTIVSDKTVRSGETWRSLLVVVIPANAQPGALIGTVTEVWEETSNYYSSYYRTPECYVSRCPYQQDHGYYAQKYAYYSTYTQDYASYLNVFTAPRTSQTRAQRYSCQPAYAYGPSYGCEHAPYYGSDYGPDYAPASATQSGQSVLLTNILSCPQY